MRASLTDPLLGRKGGQIWFSSLKLASQRDITAKDTTAALCTTAVTGVPLATATDENCRATSRAFMAFNAVLQLLHSATFNSLHGITSHNINAVIGILRCSKLQVAVEKNVYERDHHVVRQSGNIHGFVPVSDTGRGEVALLK